MGTGKGFTGFRALAIAIAVAAPATAFAHAHLTDPPSRPGTNDTTIKIPPCGGLPRSASFVQYDAGATITVKLQETIGHDGCYQLQLGDKNDSNWATLKQIADPADGTGTRTMTATLPPGFTCETCTLQLRQLMNDDGTACAPDASAASAKKSVYYSCADIRIGDFPDAAPSADAGTTPDDDGGGSSSGGTTTVPTDGGGKTTNDSDPGASSRNLRSGAGDDGCNVGWGATSGLSFFVSAGIGAMALLRRRRRG